jgi:hypothetical protein
MAVLYPEADVLDRDEAELLLEEAVQLCEEAVGAFSAWMPPRRPPRYLIGIGLIGIKAVETEKSWQAQAATSTLTNCSDNGICIRLLQNNTFRLDVYC